MNRTHYGWSNTATLDMMEWLCDTGDKWVRQEEWYSEWYHLQDTPKAHAALIGALACAWAIKNASPEEWDFEEIDWVQIGIVIERRVSRNPYGRASFVRLLNTLDFQEIPVILAINTGG